MTADAAALAEFAERTFTEAFGAQNKPDDLEAYLASAYGVAHQARELADPDGITLVAADGDRLVAYTQLRRGSAPPCVTQENPIEIRRFYVDKPAQGTGLAAALMAEAHRAARELGGRHIWLGAWERNARGLAFYRKVAFVDVGAHDFYVGTDRQTDRVLVVPVLAK